MADETRRGAGPAAAVGLKGRVTQPDLLGAVMEVSDSAVCVLDASGHVLEANAAAETLLELPARAPGSGRYPAPAWRSTRLDGGELEREAKPFVVATCTGEPVRDVRHAIEWPDGRRKVLSFNAVPVRDDSRAITRVALCATDITERLGFEERARENTAWLRMAMEAAQLGIWSWNVDTNEVRWSHDVETLFGLAPGEFGGTYDAYADLIHPDDKERVLDKMAATVESDAATYTIEHRLIRPDGSEHWIEARGRVFRDEAGRATSIVGTVMDVTKRKTAELALRASEQAFRTLLETVPSYIVSVAPDRTIRFLNRTLPHLRVEDVIGVDVVSFMAEETRDEYAEALRRAFETGELQELEGKALQPDGEPGSFLLRMGPVMEGDSVESVTIVGVDVTQLKRAEDALLESQEQLRRAQRLESVGRLAGGVAHDFNNLLTVIGGCLDLLEARFADRAEIAELTRPIREAAERGASLTRQLLAFARKQVVQPRVVDLNARIREASELLQRFLGEDVELELVLADDLWPTEIDPGQFEQVLANLAINARDAMPDGGRLTIESRNEPSADGDAVLVAVRDTGVGIPEDELPFVFEPFFTTKGSSENAAVEGTGLGLATCFGIVTQAGGQIEVESSPGKGALFRVSLPRSGGTPHDVERQEGPERMLAGSGTVLLVEDDPMVRRVTRAMLREAGYDLLEAEDGLEALDVFRANESRVDLVVADVVMPKLSGTALARELLAARHDLDVLLVSGYSTELSSLGGLPDERTHLLQKPYTGKALTEKIRAIMPARTRT